MFMIEEIKEIQIKKLLMQRERAELEKALVIIPKTTQLKKQLADLKTELYPIDLEQLDQEMPQPDPKQVKKLRHLNKQVERTKKRELKLFGWDKSLIKKSMETLDQHIICAEQAKSLADLKISPLQAVHMLQRQGRVPLLSDADLSIEKHERNYTDRSALVAVLDTDILPENGKVMHTKSRWILNDGYASKFRLKKPSRYTIITPVENLPGESMEPGITPNNLTMNQSFDLTPKAWIICHVPDALLRHHNATKGNTALKDDLTKFNNPQMMHDYLDHCAKVQQANPNVSVIGVNTDAPHRDVVRAFISQLGYRVEEVCEKGWADEISNQQFQALLHAESQLKNAVIGPQTSLER